MKYSFQEDHVISSTFNGTENLYHGYDRSQRKSYKEKRREEKYLVKYYSFFLSGE